LNRKIAIIGAGFTGLAIAQCLMQHPHFSQFEIEIFDSRRIGTGTSGIASGLLHPYAGAHAKQNWRGKEGFNATKELIEISSQTLGRSVTANSQGILRLAWNESQSADFKLCAERYPNDARWLDAETCQRLAPGSTYKPGLWIHSGLTIYTSLYLKGLWMSCEQSGISFRQKEILSLDELDGWDLVLAATGAETLQLPQLSHLPLSLIKGQILELSWPENIPPLNCALNSQVYILMTETGKTCLVGATYEREAKNADIDLETAKGELLSKAYEIFPPLRASMVLNCFAGMRASAPQHIPLLKEISPKRWILTGMGSKGLLYHALFAKELVQKALM